MDDRLPKPVAQPRSDPQPTAIAPDAVVGQFVERWRRGERPAIESYLPNGTTAGDPGAPGLLPLVRADMAERARRGEVVRLEGYLDRFPTLGSNDSWLRELVIEEFCLRRQYGDRPTLDEYAVRFPAQVAALRAELSRADPAAVPDTGAERETLDLAPSVARSLVGLLSFDAEDALHGHHAIESSSAGDAAIKRIERIPRQDSVVPRRTQLKLDAGAQIGDFEIVRLLGEGGVARVYLARQRSLDRLVALKVSANTGDEGRTLASLEHDHVVQVFAEQVVDDKRLMAMRYMPSITLDRLLERLDGLDRRQLAGRDLVACVDAEVGEPPASQDATTRDALYRLDFVRAACRLMTGLTRALEHAHRQRVLHRDVKPANILLAQSGRALLMDFNIAARRTPAGDDDLGNPPAEQVFGGTPAYMAPEHLSAMALQTATQVERVDERSDIFSLGVVFYELLTGRHPFRLAGPDTTFTAAINQMLADRLQGPPPVPLDVVAVTPGLESILTKCLAALASDRYQSASELTEDLERFLAHRPLRFAVDPSSRERAAKWWRRHPAIRAALIAAAAVLLVVGVVSAVGDSHRLGRADVLLARVEANLDAGDSRQARRLLDAANQTLAAPLGVLRYFGGADRRVASRARANKLAATVAQTELRRFQRLAYSKHAGVPLTNIAQDGRVTLDDPLDLYEALTRDDWQLAPAFLALDLEQQAEVEEVVTELLIDRAQGGMRFPPTNASFQIVGAVACDILRRVPSRFQQSPAVVQLREDANGLPARGPAAPATPPADWNEFDAYFMGVREANEERFAVAINYFAAAQDRCEDNEHALKFWAHFQHADCATRLKRTDEAVLEYGGCIALRSDVAWPYYNLGLIYGNQGAAGKLELAVQNFDQAIRCDPKLAVAHSSRGAVLHKQERFVEAIAACTEAIRLGLRAPEPYCNRGSAYVGLGKHEDAVRDFRTALEIAPHFEDARKNLRLLGIPVTQ